MGIANGFAGRMARWQGKLSIDWQKPAACHRHNMAHLSQWLAWCVSVFGPSVGPCRMPLCGRGPFQDVTGCSWKDKKEAGLCSLGSCGLCFYGWNGLLTGQFLIILGRGGLRNGHGLCQPGNRCSPCRQGCVHVFVMCVTTARVTKKVCNGKAQEEERTRDEMCTRTCR